MKDFEHNVGFYAKVIKNTLDARANAMLKRFDLTLVQLDVIRFLKKSKERGLEVRQKNIEEFFHISNPTVSKILDRLEAKHLIERNPDPSDRRTRVILLTEDGEAVIRAAYKELAQVEKQMLEGLSPEEIRQGKTFLHTIVQNLCACQKEEESKHDQNPSCSDPRI